MFWLNVEFQEYGLVFISNDTVEENEATADKKKPKNRRRRKKEEQEAATAALVTRDAISILGKVPGNLGKHSSLLFAVALGVL